MVLGSKHLEIVVGTIPQRDSKHEYQEGGV